MSSIFFVTYRIIFSHSSFFFFFNDTATTEIYTLSLHDALPIYRARPRHRLAADRGEAGRLAGRAALGPGDARRNRGPRPAGARPALGGYSMLKTCARAGTLALFSLLPLPFFLN